MPAERTSPGFNASAPQSVPVFVAAIAEPLLAVSTFLGVTVPANTDAATALKTALDTLFNHPNVGPFFGRQIRFCSRSKRRCTR